MQTATWLSQYLNFFFENRWTKIVGYFTNWKNLDEIQRMELEITNYVYFSF